MPDKVPDPGFAEAKYMYEEFLRSMEVNEDGTPKYPDDYGKSIARAQKNGAVDKFLALKAKLNQ